MKLLAAFSFLFASVLAKKQKARYFRRVAVFPVCSQIDATCNVDDETLAEIVAASTDGNTLIYTDSATQTAGFVDISDPSTPLPLGVLNLEGGPTSVAVVGPYALVVVDDSADFVNTAGSLKVINISTQTIITSIDLGGQPDSISVSSDGLYAVVCIENERDEDVNDGLLPQLPAGFVVIVDLVGPPTDWTTRIVELTGLDNIKFPSDPEPEYVSINSDNVAVVTLQENNGVVLIDLESNSVINSFDAGEVTLENVDNNEDDVILQIDNISDIPREPDGCAWIDKRYFATADEGDLEGGSRGFTIFDSRDGSIVYASGNSLELLAAAVGHYPESRSENKGVEPENVAFANYNGDKLLFVNTERANAVFVYDVAKPTKPKFLQVLPAGVGPEGGLTIPKRDLYVVASEVDNRDDNIRSVINIYQRGSKIPFYPTLISENRGDGTPIAWSALSGLAAEIRVSTKPVKKKGVKKPPKKGNNPSKILYAVEDSYYAKSRMFTIDVSTFPAKLTSEVRLRDSLNQLSSAPLGSDLVNDDGTVNLDLEGIAVSKSGGFWVCSEGAGTVGDASRPVTSLNYLIKVNNSGSISKVVVLPDEVNDIQVRFGFEGCAEGAGRTFGKVVVVAFQRAWTGETNPRLGAYNQVTGEWTFYFYPLDEVESQNGGWVGLSDIAPLGVGGQFLVVERDNMAGPDAVIKRIYKIDLGKHSPGDTVTKTLFQDLYPVLAEEGGLIVEKIEGLAVDSSGEVWIVNDNDGVDDNNGETLLLNVRSSNLRPKF